MGPFTYRGIIIDNDGCDPASWNNHGSIECVNGQWYVFYHRCSRGSQRHRRLCIEKIYINSDGTIDEVEMTSQGIGEPFAPGEALMGYQACGLKGTIHIDVDKEYEEVLTAISDGDEAVFRYVQNEQSWKKICVTASGRGTIEVEMDREHAGTVKLASQGKKYQIYTAVLCTGSGVKELRLKFTEVENLRVAKIVLE